MTDHFHGLLRIRKGRATPLVRLHAFMTWSGTTLQFTRSNEFMVLSCCPLVHLEQLK